MPSDSTIPLKGSSHAPANAGVFGGERTKLQAPVWLYLSFVILPVEFFLGSVALTPLRVLLLCMVIPLTANLFSGRYGKLLATDYLFFAHILWAIVAVAVNNPSRVVENTGSAAVEFLGGYLVARAYIRTPDQFETLIRILLFLTVISLPFAIAESLSGRAVIPHLIESIPGLSTVKQVDIPKRMGLSRVQNVFAHPIHYGLFCSATFSLVLVGLKDRMSFFMRLLSCLAICFGVFLSLSSGALLAIILQIGLISWAVAMNRFKRKWLMLVGLFVLAYITIDLLSNRTPSRVFMSYATFSPQTAYYRSIINDYGMRNVWANPIFGLGLRTWFRPAYMKTGSVDNYWLVMAMKYGIPGFSLVVSGYFIGLFKVGRHDLSFSTRASRLRLAWMITFCGLSFTLTTVHVWTSIYSFVFFFFGSGLWMANYTAADAGDTGATLAPEKTLRARSLSYSRDHAAPAEVKSPSGPAYSRPPPSRPETIRESRNAASGSNYSRFVGPKPAGAPSGSGKDDEG